MPESLRKVLYGCRSSLRAEGGMTERGLSRKCTEDLRETDNPIVLVTCHLSSAALGTRGIVCLWRCPGMEVRVISPGHPAGK